jgi:hypothetical protein
VRRERDQPEYLVNMTIGEAAGGSVRREQGRLGYPVNMTVDEAVGGTLYDAHWDQHRL